MFFYIQSPFQLEAFEMNQSEFVCDDLIVMLQSSLSKVVDSKVIYNEKLKYLYKVTIERVLDNTNDVITV